MNEKQNKKESKQRWKKEQEVLFRKSPPMDETLFPVLFDYLDAELDVCACNRPITLIVKRKPRKCMNCGGKVVPFLYGEPSDKGIELIYARKALMGGCIINAKNPDWGCLNCETMYMLPPLLR